MVGGEGGQVISVFVESDGIRGNGLKKNVVTPIVGITGSIGIIIKAGPWNHWKDAHELISVFGTDFYQGDCLWISHCHALLIWAYCDSTYDESCIIL
jgi:hypothetical protein